MLEMLMGPLILCVGIGVGMVAFFRKNSSVEEDKEAYEESVVIHNTLVVKLADEKTLDLGTVCEKVLDQKATLAIEAYKIYLAATKATASLAEAKLANTQVREVNLVGVDETTAAMVMAILCHRLDDTSLNFVSIKAV